MRLDRLGIGVSPVSVRNLSVFLTTTKQQRCRNGCVVPREGQVLESPVSGKGLGSNWTVFDQRRLPHDVDDAGRPLVTLGVGEA